MAASEFSVEYKAKDWIAPKQLRLAPQDEEDLVNQKMFRTAFLDLKIRVVALPKTKELTKGQEKDFELTVTKAAWSARAKVRAEASKVFTDVVEAWRVEQKPETAGGEEAKQALAGVKKLDETLKKLLRELPRELREAAADVLKMSADDFVTVNECDYDLRLRNDLLAGLEDGRAEDDAKKHDEKLTRLLSASKGKWVNCCVVWLSNDVGRLLVAKLGKELKTSEIKTEGELLPGNSMAKKSTGKVYVKGAKLLFEFLEEKDGIEGGPLPGGKSPEAPLRKIIKLQTEKQYQIEVTRVAKYSGVDHGQDDEEPEAKKPKAGKPSTSESTSNKSGAPAKSGPQAAKPIKARAPGA